CADWPPARQAETGGTLPCAGSLHPTSSALPTAARYATVAAPCDTSAGWSVLRLSRLFREDDACPSFHKVSGNIRPSLLSDVHRSILPSVPCLRSSAWNQARPSAPVWDQPLG